MILREIDSLPTLPAIAMRLLTLTASDDSSANEVTELISSDPVMTGKILSMCKRASLGVRADAVTIDKAVVLLGFEAVRMAVLSIKVFDVFDKPAPEPTDPDATAATNNTFDRVNFWRHSLAVGVAAELIATAHPDARDLPRSEAFVCGLMHDMGKLALDFILPKAFARVVELTELNNGNIAELERRVIGIDHHTAGKRLAEQWQLPRQILDTMWMHSSSYETLPRLEHRRLVGLIGLADLIVRRQHIGYSGNFTFERDPEQLAEVMGLNPKVIETLGPKLYDELQRREGILDLDGQPSRELYLESIQRANQTLWRLNSAREKRTRLATVQSEVLDGITAFFTAATPGRTVQDAMDSVVASARAVLGKGYTALIYEPPQHGEAARASWLICEYDHEGAATRSELIAPPLHAPSLTTLDQAAPDPAAIMPWVVDALTSNGDAREIQMLPLNCAWGVAAVMVHDLPRLPPTKQLDAITSCWGAAIASASQHEDARRLGEELAQTNRALAEAQDRLLHSESMARLGEMAAGAAHEMNNPLAVISGRSQMLAMSIDPGSKNGQAAKTIVEQCKRLTDLITSLRMFAEPPEPERRSCDIGTVLDDAVRRTRSDSPKPTGAQIAISVKVQSGLPTVSLDPDQIGLAIRELLLNAVQSSPRSSITITGRIDTDDQLLVIQVSDDGGGMNGYTLAHAMDPFFSAKPAGRQAGMGLSRAKQLVESHGGQLGLRSAPNVGTVATMSIPLDSQE